MIFKGFDLVVICNWDVCILGENGAVWHVQYRMPAYAAYVVTITENGHGKNGKLLKMATSAVVNAYCTVSSLILLFLYSHLLQILEHIRSPI